MKLALVISMTLAAGAASAEPTFPRIDPSVQATRDTDRGVILMQERGEETKALLAAEKALASGALGEQDKLAITVERHRKNLAALDAEIQRLGGTAPAVAMKSAGPMRLRAASAAPAAPADDAAVPFWDVYRRKEPQP
jgi:hypothetical protein